jgi:hypothetical protein
MPELPPVTMTALSFNVDMILFLASPWAGRIV